MVPYTVTDGARIVEPLIDAPPSPLAGAQLYRSVETGCARCHGTPGAGGTEKGPDLAGVAERREPGAIRLRLVAPEVLDPSLADHAYYRAGQRRGADDPLYGGPRLTARQIEDLVAWLATLTWAP